MTKAWKRLIGNKRLLSALLIIIGLIVIGSIAIVRIQKENASKYSTEDTAYRIFAKRILEKLKDDKAHFMAEADFGLCQEGKDFSPEVSDEDVDKFLAENVSDEDESDLFVHRLLPQDYINATGYDGVYRDVSCWGDSMTYGQASTNVTVPVNGQLTTLYEPTYPSTLQMYSGLTVHNLGISGETSIQIATRQGGTPMYINSDIDITDGVASTQVMSSYTQSVIHLGDFSGYVDRSNSEWYGSGLCYYEDESGYRLCKVNQSGNICTVQKYNIGTQTVNADDSVGLPYLAEPQNVFMTYIHPATGQIGDRVTVETLEDKEKENVPAVGPTAGPTEPTVDPTQPVDGSAQSEQTSQTPTTGPKPTQPTTQPTTSAATENPIQKPTEPQTERPTEPQTETEAPTADLTPAHLNSGTVLMTKASIDRKNDLLILEMGSNGGWRNGYQDLIYQYDEMILYSGCKYYIIIGDTDDPEQVRADGVSERGIGVGDTAWEATLRKAYGDHFINMRVELIKNGLQYCGLNTSQADLSGYTSGEISKKLRTTLDNTHLNGYGYYAKGYTVYLKGRELGYW